MSVCGKFEGCAAKTVGGVGFLRVTVFLKKALLPNFTSQLPVNGTDFKLDKPVEKGSMMLHYKYDKVGRSIIDFLAFLMKKIW